MSGLGGSSVSQVVRPSFARLWPAWGAFPLVGLAVVFLGVQGVDATMVAIGLGILAGNLVIVVDYAYFTTLRVDGDLVVFRSHFGLQEDRVPIGAIQRIDAKRYPAAHSGVSAPNLVVRGRASTVKVNIKPYRLHDLRALVARLQALNPTIRLDAFWSTVAEGRDPAAESRTVPRSRW